MEVWLKSGVVKMLYITLRKLKKFTLTLILFKTRKKKESFLNVSYEYSAKSDVLNLLEGHVDPEIFSQPLFTTDFVF